jgi:hypothetical protein
MVIGEQRVRVRKAEGGFYIHQRIDIVDNSITFVPRQEASLSQAVECGMRLGLFETVAEALWISQSSLASKTVSPLTTFERSRIEGKPWHLARPKEKFPSLSITSRDQEWIRQFEDPSHVVIAPEGTPLLNSAWWSFNPKTGTLLGRASGGRGEAWTEFKVGALVEYPLVRAVVIWIVVGFELLIVGALLHTIVMIYRRIKEYASILDRYGAILK